MEAVHGALGAFNAVDCLGFVASGATLLAFAQRRMLPMRVSAIAANLFFIGYGALGPFYPVLALHLILLPLNIKRLVERRRRKLPVAAASGDRKVTLLEEWRIHKRFSHAAANIEPARPLRAANTQARAWSVAS